MIVGKFLHSNFSRGWGAGCGGVQVQDWLGSGDRNLHAIVLQLMWQGKGEKKKKNNLIRQKVHVYFAQYCSIYAFVDELWGTEFYEILKYVYQPGTYGYICVG
jgi:hypothetical protein